MDEQPGSNSGVARHRRGRVADALDDRAQVLGRGAAAAADDVDAELGDEALVRVGEPLGREVVVRVAVDDRRQPRVRQAREERARRAARGSAGARSSRPGPVAQFRPITSGRIASSAVSAAPISEPTSIRPVVSIVTCTISGTVAAGVAPSPAGQATIAALAWSRS